MRFPGFPGDSVTWLGRGWVDVSRVRLILASPVERVLVLVRGQAAQALLDAAGVVPAVDVAGDRWFGLGAGGEGGAGSVDELGLERGPQVLRQGVVVAVAG